MDKYIECGIYYIQDCYGNSYSVCYKNKHFIHLSDKQKMREKYIENSIRDGFITLTFVDTFENFII